MATVFNSANGGQFLEDLSTSYWLSEALFTALKLDLFDTIENFGSPMPADVLAKSLDCSVDALTRYLQLLEEIGLIEDLSGLFDNSALSRTYLLKDAPLYQGHIIHWRKNMKEDWQSLYEVLKNGRRINFIKNDEAQLEDRRAQYIRAMDNVARLKACECAELIKNLNGKILDVGCGSGAMAAAFLEKFPDTRATLLDIEQILPQTKKFIAARGLDACVSFHAANILETNWQLDTSYDLIILSNILHAYAEKEVIHILKMAKQYLSPNGNLLIHDFFMEHHSLKAKLSDINMLLNTYNGKVFGAEWVIAQLKTINLDSSNLIPLKTDTAVILAGHQNEENNNQNNMET